MLKIVEVENGFVRGIPAADPRIISFKGIPFAEPPIDDLRWRAPQPAKNWDGIRDCLEFAPVSMQNIPGLDKTNIYTREWNVDPEIPMSEDCLYLNIWTPAQGTEEKLPVYVWYFGGALQYGNTAEMEFDGERLARRGIVVVTVNYRINVFGFLVHPELMEQSTESPVNFGNLDQQYGLFWTKRNIAAFGGDPNNITIGGQSAGGGSVMTQLNCPGNRGYIQKAIVESGVFLDPFQERFTTSMEKAMKQGKDFFDFLGVNSLKEARALPAEVIRDKNSEFGVFWGTVVDGVYQTDTWWKNLNEGKFPDIPILMGYTNNEFITGPQAESEEDLIKEAWEKFGEKAKEYLSLVHAEKGTDIPKEKGGINSIELGIRIICQRLDELKAKGPHYVYEFGPEIPGWDSPGAFHSSDLWFFFETLAKCWRPFKGKHYDLSRQMCNYWAEFIRKGDPNGMDADGTPMERWEKFTSEKPNLMAFLEKPKAQSKTVGEMMRFLMENLSWK